MTAVAAVGAMINSLVPSDNLKKLFAQRSQLPHGPVRLGEGRDGIVDPSEDFRARDDSRSLERG